MDMEFELKKVGTDQDLVVYKVFRKGLQVGTLALDKEPYARNEAEMTKLKGEK